MAVVLDFDSVFFEWVNSVRYANPTSATVDAGRASGPMRKRLERRDCITVTRLIKRVPS